MNIYFCYYVYQVDDTKKRESYKERDYVEFKTEFPLSKEEIESKILFEWKRKRITNRVIIEIYHPEKID